MKNYLFLLALLSLSFTNVSNAQLRIGGGISIGVNIDLPLPEIAVVVGGTVCPQPQSRRPIVDNFGSIHHQNGPYGRHIYEVTGARLQPTSNQEERILYYLDTGDVLELLIHTVNPNDYNYHYYDANCGDCWATNNSIVAIYMNQEEIPLHNGSISLQPEVNGRLHNVINLHSIYDGDFNGTIVF